MYGQIQSISKNYCDVQLPAAEEVLSLPKEKVLLTQEADPKPYYVKFDDNTIKIVRGLKLNAGYYPVDYFPSKKEAQQGLHFRPSKTTKKPVRKATKTASIVEVLNESLASNLKDINVSGNNPADSHLEVICGVDSPVPLWSS